MSSTQQSMLTDHIGSLPALTKGWVPLASTTICLVHWGWQRRARPNGDPPDQRRLGLPHPWGSWGLGWTPLHWLLAFGEVLKPENLPGWQERIVLTIPGPMASNFYEVWRQPWQKTRLAFLFQVSWLGPGERKNDLEKAFPVSGRTGVSRSHQSLEQQKRKMGTMVYRPSEPGAAEEENGNNGVLAWMYWGTFKSWVTALGHRI